MNLWTQFRQLLPESPLLVGIVLSLNADGTSTVQLPDGANIQAQGQLVAESAKAFVRGGKVEGQAPDLPVFNVTV